MNFTKPGSKFATYDVGVMNFWPFVTNRLSLKSVVTFLGIFLILYTSYSFASSQVSNRDTDRRVLFELAFENLGFYMAAVEKQMHLDPAEKKAFNDIVRLANERKRAELFREPNFTMTFSTDPNEFIVPGEEIRTAVTNLDDPLSEVKVNLNIIQDPSVNLDLLSAVQILIHEFAHKAGHSKKQYVDTMAAEVAKTLRNSSVKYEIEPGYSIFLLGLTSPYIDIYNFLRKKGTEDGKLLTEVYLYNLLYKGMEVTMLEYRGNKIRPRNEISGYLMNPVGFSNVPQGQSMPLLPLSLSSVQNIAKENVGERFPVIKLSIVTHQELVQYNGATVTSPSVVKSDLARQMAANTLYHELVIYTDRSGIRKISKRDFKQQYMPDSAVVSQFEFRNGYLYGQGQIKIEKSELDYLIKNKLKLSALIKFRDSQTLVPVDYVQRSEGIKFRFSMRADPKVDIVMVDQLQMSFNHEGRYRSLVIPVDEAKRLKFNTVPKSQFDLVAWRLHDSRGERYFHTGPISSPIIDLVPDNMAVQYELAFLFRSETPIRELVITTKQGDQIHQEDGSVKFSRLLERTERISAEHFIQQKVGPYYKVFLDMATTLTPDVVVEATDSKPKQVAISPEYRIVISKMRAINENLQVVGTDDPLIQTILNPPWRQQSRSNSCRDRLK